MNKDRYGVSEPSAVLSPLFSDHMVLAAGKPIRFFGKGEGNVRVTWNGVIQETQCESGHWIMEFEPMTYGGPYQLHFTAENADCTLEDIYVGEVYLISGQSNMEFKLQESNEPEEMYQGNPQIRMYSNLRAAQGEYFFPNDGWVLLTKENAGFWSAIGYYTAMERQRLLSEEYHKEIAIGLITGYQGASVIESWMPEKWMEEKKIFTDPKELEIFHDRSARHGDLFHPEYSQWNSDGFLYRLIIAETIPFAVNAVIWYQGESNTAERESVLYRKKLGAMIDCWREGFWDPQLKFVIIQIADFISRLDEGWKNVQKAQEDIRQDRENICTVISKDVCEQDLIHPVTKNLLSHRVAEALH